MSDIAALFDWYQSSKQSSDKVHVDKESILKEIRQIPSCDGMSCFYCKDWASFVWKSIYAGTVTHKQDDSQPLMPPEFMCLRIEKYVRHDPFSSANKRVTAEASESVVDMVEELLECFTQWLQSKPTPWQTQDVVRPLVLQQPDISKVEGNESKDRSRSCQFLRQVTQDKKGFSISKVDLLSPETRLLFTQDALNIKDYYCHDRGTSQLPTEVDADVENINARLKVFAQVVETDLQPKLKAQWSTIEELIVFIRDNLKQLESIVGLSAVENALNRKAKGCFIPFETYWASKNEIMEEKAKIGDEMGRLEADHVMDEYLEFLTEALSADGIFEEADMIGSRLQNYISQFSDIFFARVQQIDIPRNKELVQQIECEARSSVQNLSSITETRIKEIIDDMQLRRDDLMVEIEDLRDSYESKARPTYVGRLERVAKKDFKKRVKKVETMYNQLLKAFSTSLSNAFASFYLVLVVYMIVKFFVYENTGRESDIVSNAIARRIDEVKKLLQGISTCKSSYNVGVTNGCSELQSVFLKVFYREIQRQYFDGKALEAQEELLRSLEDEEKKSSSEKSKKAQKKDKSQKKAPVKVEPVVVPAVPIAQAPPQAKSPPAQNNKQIKKEKLPDSKRTSNTTTPTTPADSRQNSPVEPIVVAIPQVNSLPMIEESKYLELQEQFAMLKTEYHGTIMNLRSMEHTAKDATTKNGELIKLCQDKDAEIEALRSKFFASEQKVVELGYLKAKLEKDLDTQVKQVESLSAQIKKLKELPKHAVPLPPPSKIVTDAQKSSGTGNPFQDKSMKTAQNLLSELNNDIRNIFDGSGASSPSPQTASVSPFGAHDIWNLGFNKK